MAAVPGGAGLTPVTRFVETQDGVQLAYRSWVAARCCWTSSRRSCAGSVRRLPGAMARKKITIRPPGLKPTTKVGTLGPYRGRLGLAWVIAPVIVGALILVAGYVALTR